ncbi:hypothetical protein [Galbibacter sp. BG1]
MSTKTKKKQTNVTEVTTLKITDLSKINIRGLKEVKVFEENQKALVADNPFVKIEDSATYEIAKTRRTALRKGRTSLQNQEKLIAKHIKSLRTKAGDVINNLISITEPHEDKQQEEVSRWEEIKEKERQEKARIEEERQDAIKQRIDNFHEKWKGNIQTLTYDKIDETLENLKDEYENIEDVDEFDYLLDDKFDTLTELYKEKSKTLTVAENQRVEAERLESEKAEFEAKKKKEEERQKELKPYLIFIRDYSQVLNMSDEDYKNELDSLKKQLEAHQESERKKSEKEEQERNELAELKRKNAELQAEKEELKKKSDDSTKNHSVSSNQSLFTDDDNEIQSTNETQEKGDTTVYEEIQSGTEPSKSKEIQSSPNLSRSSKETSGTKQKIKKEEIENLQIVIGSIQYTQEPIELKSQSAKDFLAEISFEIVDLQQSLTNELDKINEAQMHSM